MRFLRSPLGPPFRQTFGKRISSVVLGAPFSTFYPTICSIKSLAVLAVASLDEDPFGRVSPDIPILIRTYTQTIETVEAFIQNLPPHWTDVKFQDSDRRVADVAAVVICLKTGLRDMLEAFEKYAPDLGITPEDLEVARKATRSEEEGINMRENKSSRGLNGTISSS